MPIWVVSRVAVQEPGRGFRRRGQTHVVEWDGVSGHSRREETQPATQLVAQLMEMRAADAASVRSAVVLPLPLLPRSPTTSPGRTVRQTSRSPTTPFG